MIDVEQVRTSHPIATVVEQRGVPLRPAGRRLVGRCPFHADREPSFTVYPETQSYFCFGCGAGGDVIDFVARHERLDFRAAVARLGACDLPGRGVGDRATHRSKVSAWGRGSSNNPVAGENRMRQDPQVLAVVDAAAWFYHEQLCQCEVARDYLARRGIALDTAIRERVGYAPGSGLVHFLHKRDLDLGVAEAIGLLRGGRETLAGRIVIPHLAHSRAAWLTGRAIGDARRRYLTVRLPVPLLGRAFVNGDEVVLTEGPFDWLTARQWGLPALALLGTHVSARTVRSLQQYRRVYLVLDADPAGQRATRQLQDELGAVAVPVSLPPGVSDLNEQACRRGGEEALRAALHAAGYRGIPARTAWVDRAADPCAAPIGHPA